MAAVRNNSNNLISRPRSARGTSVEVTVLTDAINNLNNRIEKTETDFIGHLQKVEERLDQIVDLTKTVAVLQSQASQQTDHIIEVRTQLRENAQKTDNSITRIHTRMDELASHQRDKSELLQKEVDIRIENVKQTVDITDKEFKQWLNRGVGAWAIFIILISIGQAAFYRWVEGIDQEKAAIVKSVSQASIAIEKQSHILDRLNTSITEQQQSIKRLEVMSNDADRQIELLRNRPR